MNYLRVTGSMLALIFLLLISCDRDNEIETINTTDRPDPTIIEGYTKNSFFVNASVTGRVVDKNNNGIQGATVSYNDLSTSTNEYGHFFFIDEELDMEGSFIKVSKASYFDGSRTFYPKEGNMAFIRIQLIEKSFSESFDATSGGQIAVENGGSIVFSPNSIVDQQTNTLYQGEVKVVAYWLDPTSTNTYDRMPGDLAGIDKLNEPVILGTYGMMSVELESPSGDKLQIAEGKTAELSFPIPQEILVDAPSEIPLWYFNERYGIWVEDGVAQLEDDTYVGTVEHFSFWNCDAPFELVSLDFTILEENGLPLSDVSVKLSAELGNNQTVFSYGYPDENGFLIGKVPANRSITLGVLDHCNEKIYEDQIGPFSIAQSLGDITVTATEYTFVSLEGSLLDCDGNPVTNGLIILDREDSPVNKYIYTDGNPFSFSLLSCSPATDIELTFIDLDKVGQVVSKSISFGEMNLGNISICQTDIENVVEITIGSDTYSIPNPILRIDKIDNSDIDTLHVSSYLPNPNEVRFHFGLFGLEPGPREPGELGPSGHTVFSGLTVEELNWRYNPKYLNSFVITELGRGAGEKIKGTFDLEMWVRGVPNETARVTGKFSLTRVE